MVLPPSDGQDAIAHLQHLASGPFAGCELRAPSDDRGWAAAAAQTGWMDAGVRERWRGRLHLRIPDADFIGLGELGRSRFTDALTEALVGGIDTRFGRDGAGLFESWLPHQPDEQDSWGLVGDLGIVVPRIVEPGVGSLLFVAVLPSHRGRGLGRRVHDAALANLWKAGARTYEDEVSADNTAMIRLLGQSGSSLLDRYRSLVRR